MYFGDLDFDELSDEQMEYVEYQLIYGDGMGMGSDIDYSYR